MKLKSITFEGQKLDFDDMVTSFHGYHGAPIDVIFEIIKKEANDVLDLNNLFDDRYIAVPMHKLRWLQESEGMIDDQIGENVFKILFI